MKQGSGIVTTLGEHTGTETKNRLGKADNSKERSTHWKKIEGI
jgi:hypothetical protein